jgi:cobyric acid synthase
VSSCGWSNWSNGLDYRSVRKSGEGYTWNSQNSDLGQGLRKMQQMNVVILKPHCIQSSQVLVPAGTSKSTSRRHGIQAVTR